MLEAGGPVLPPASATGHALSSPVGPSLFLRKQHMNRGGTHHSLDNRGRSIRPYILPAAAALAAGLTQYIAMPKRKGVPMRSLPPTKRTRRVKGYNIGRSLGRVPPTELKAFDRDATTILFRNAALNANVLNLPVEGSDLFNRIGRKIYMKSLQLRIWVNPGQTTIPDVGRILLVYDTQPNGSAPALGDILRTTNATVQALANINLDNRQRFTILMDKQIYLPAMTLTSSVVSNPQANFSTNTTDHSITKFVKLKGLETVFNATNGGTIADINSGALYLFGTSQLSDQVWNLTFSSRLRYYD